LSVTDEIENRSGRSVELYSYALVSRHGMPQSQGYHSLHNRLLGSSGSAGLQELKSLDAGGSKSFRTIGGWIAFTDKYWAAILIPNLQTSYEAKFTSTKTETQTVIQADYLASALSIPSGGKRSS